MKFCKKDDFKVSKCWCLAVSALFSIAVLFLLQAIAQDYTNPCFFCHMNVMVEMKVKAVKHWEAGVDCKACHGASGEHIDVEDNSVKPDSIWTDKDVHLLCGHCHDVSLLDYKKSAHANLIIGSNKKEAEKTPSCVICHGAHELKTDKQRTETCLGCHTPLPNTCKIDSPKKESQEKLMTCKSCHEIHSLKYVKKENSPVPERKP